MNEDRIKKGDRVRVVAPAITFRGHEGVVTETGGIVHRVKFDGSQFSWRFMETELEVLPT